MNDARRPLNAVALRQCLSERSGPLYWRSLEELANAPDVQAMLDSEFPLGSPALDRRRFLQLMGASLALGGLAGCSPPREAVPYVEQPEMIVAGESRWYAGAIPFAGIAQPVLARTHVGRPTKLEGNPEHPACRGASDAFTQAAILQLYDPDRSRAPRQRGRESSWQAFQREAVARQETMRAQQGRGLHILLGASSSPTLERLLEHYLSALPDARLYRFEPFEGTPYAATEMAFGEPLETHPRLDRAELVVSFESDLLGAGPRQTLLAGRWAQRRLAAARGDGEARLVVLESLHSLTGANASERRVLDSAGLWRHLAALAAALGEGSAVPLEAGEQDWIARLADALRRRPGRCLLVAGERTPVPWQAMVHRLNERLGNVGHTVEYSAPLQTLAVAGRPLQPLENLVTAAGRGEAEQLLMFDCNPAYLAPDREAFIAALEQVPWRLHAGLDYDETAARSHWHLPLSHALEAWQDGRAADGSLCLAQPAVRPFYSTRTPGEILALLQGELTPDSRPQLRQTWASLDETAWRDGLARGFIPGSTLPLRHPVSAPVDLGPPPPGTALELRFSPDPSLWDGRFANLGWLQELPKPLSKLTWTNAVGVAPALAARLGLASGDRVRVQAGLDAVEGAVWVTPGQHPGVIELTAGYGRPWTGRVGRDLGFDIGPLRDSNSPWRRTGAGLTRLSGQQRLPGTQLQQSMRSERALIRRLPRDQARLPAEPIDLPSLYPPRQEGAPQWSMLIDLDQCIGCNACVVACQAENNVPVVGPEQVAQGRIMHWLRIDHYYRGTPEAPESAFMPVPCMHCENAPCELGCPVNATVHGPDGLNQMIYNRCIGTRTCGAYCPYKVRRFNWFDWTRDDAPAIQAQRNPDVTVRSRGVMEKCTYCVQRINRAANEPGQALQIACQQACPTQAILFGDRTDVDSPVHRQRDSRRHYALLEELNTRPRTTYLAALEDEPLEGDDA